MSHHTTDPECPLCAEKLLQAHPDIVAWFKDCIKPKFPDAHISWSFRDKVNQNQCFAEGKSKLSWPMSAHNKSDDQGNPCAMALDLFQLASNNMACWPYQWFKSIIDYSNAEGHTVQWGGNWKSIGDGDHYQLF
jgi:hypothetical protein